MSTLKKVIYFHKSTAIVFYRS